MVGCQGMRARLGAAVEHLATWTGPSLGEPITPRAVAARDWRGLEALEPRLLLAANPLTPNPSITGELAPSVNLDYIDGSPFAIEDIDQPILVMDFWATWCAPCFAALPLLHNFKDSAEQLNKRVDVVTINVSETAATAQAAWDDNGFDLPIVMDPNFDAFSAYGSIYNNSGLPFTVVVSGGKVAAHHIGFSPSLDQLLMNDINALEPLLPPLGGPEIEVQG